jgi:hypothetical protein
MSGEDAVMNALGQRARTYLGILAAALLLLVVGAFAGAPVLAGGRSAAHNPPRVAGNSRADYVCTLSMDLFDMPELAMQFGPYVCGPR